MIARHDIAAYLDTFIKLYIALIFVRILVSYLPRVPYIPVLRAFLEFVESVTDPYLRLFRRLVPQVSLGGAALDLSPMVATIVLIVVGQYVLVPLIAG